MRIKKILKNKIFITIFLALDLALFIALAILLAPVFPLVAVIYLACHVIAYFILVKCIFGISLINRGRIKNKRTTKKIRSELPKDEFYLKELDIATFDGSGSLTHPHILYFKQPFSGYKYWLIFTPYDNNNVELENPSLAVSNDGIHFKKLPKQPNPLLSIIKRSNPNTYYSDPFMIFTDKLEIWYRFTIESHPAVNKIYRITTKDGVNYSEPELMLDDGSYYMSLSIVKDGNLYYMYYFDIDNRLYVRKSSDLSKWNEPKEVSVDGFHGKLWHGEVREIDGHNFLLFMDREYNLYIAQQENPTHFATPQKFRLSYYSRHHRYTGQILYKSSMAKVGDFYYIYIPFRVSKLSGIHLHKEWRLTLTKIRRDKLDALLEASST